MIKWNEIEEMKTYLQKIDGRAASNPVLRLKGMLHINNSVIKHL